MCPERIMRKLRYKYKISLAELAVEVGITPQWISQIELMEETSTAKQLDLIRNAFTIISYKEKYINTKLSEDLATHFDRLLDFVEEEI